MLNKPRGLVTSAADEKGRETIYSCLPPDLPWVAPVGRLDKASEGLLLLTNDSEWAARVLAPESHLEKTYHVQISGRPGPEVARKLEQGVGTRVGFLRVRKASILREGTRNSWLEIILDEGKNRHIRRMPGAGRHRSARAGRSAQGLITGADERGEAGARPGPGAGTAQTRTCRR